MGGKNIPQKTNYTYRQQEEGESMTLKPTPLSIAALKSSRFQAEGISSTTLGQFGQKKPHDQKSETSTLTIPLKPANRSAPAAPAPDCPCSLVLHLQPICRALNKIEGFLNLVSRA